jgi:protein CpxP
MLNFKKHCIGSLLALSIGAMAAGAYADTPSAPASAPSSTSSAMPMHRGAPTPEMRAKFAAKMEKRQEELHAKLKLTAAQEPAWRTFVDQTKPPQRDANKDKQHHEDRAAWAKLTTPERMEKFLARMQTREQFLTVRLDAVKTFYAVLTPAQQKTFDAAYAHGPFGGHHGHHRHHGEHDKAAAAQ